MSDDRKRLRSTVEYATPWFELVSKRVTGEPEPFYALRLIDYVCVVALTPEHEIVLVRQYRPAVEQETLELPAGHVERNQTPEEAARSELADETGFTAPDFVLLGTFFSDTGRNENRTWCYLAAGARAMQTGCGEEEGIAVAVTPVADLFPMILRGEFHQGPHIAALMLAALRVSLPGFPPVTRSSGSAVER